MWTMAALDEAAIVTVHNTETISYFRPILFIQLDQWQ